jgi:hypothetical protein
MENEKRNENWTDRHSWTSWEYICMALGGFRREDRYRESSERKYKKKTGHGKNDKAGEGNTEQD